ncbi:MULTISPECIES: CPBP family intramembrane glutamic endopeptidase [Ruminococcus]|uniref:CAAX prenyl protease 2/Lysostaphin resistance protein A-like domain-containing protein n=1 Tax=Ruminococcus flavefaciens TaxID=1265 RepID=A0A1M7GMF4_RUMFL|nr:MULTISPECIES: type II CAAX endopeptidase family protein [Ruminococcus]MCR4795857.1 CPBP family intramembrane metalloprotease [Ruminococcus sp.]SHM17572.1 hypothetical protein SAMN04487860_101394 [Ruminococcus flavefaciens]
MTEFDDTSDQRAQFAALNHEIYNLTKQLEAKEREYLDSTKTDLYDPFKNPTEFRWYRDDYSEILPWITMPEFSVPFEPAKVEKSAIRRYYNIGGFTMLFQFLASNLLALGLIYLIKYILAAVNPDASAGSISHYISRSSIFPAINMITYLVANIGFAFIGLKWAKIKSSFMIKTKELGFGDILKYCLSGLFIWVVAAYLSSGIEDIFSQYGFTTDVMEEDYGKTGIGFAVMTVYSCIIAPVTEEIFFRGALMKIFSKSNQHFGIMASAVFFGLAHGNLPQFMLAFLIGIFFGHIDMKHNSIVPSVIVHIFINSMVTVVSLVKDENMLMAGLTLLMFAAAIVGLVMLILFRKECKLPVSTPAQTRRGFAIAKTSVGCIIAFAVHLGYLALLIISTKK